MKLFSGYIMYRLNDTNKKRMAQNQGGFVLVLALVLLAVMTLIGVSSMNSANVELKATANARQFQLAFNDVQSLLGYSLAKEAVTTDGTALNFLTLNGADQNVSLGNSQADVIYAGCSAGVGSSLEDNKGFSYLFYNVQANGSNTTGTSTVLLNQGVRNRAASC